MEDRLKKLRKLFLEHDLDAILVSSIPNIVHLTNYSGFSTHEREAYLLLTKAHNFIFTDGRYTEAVLKHIPHFILKEITDESPFSALLKKLITEQSIQNIGFEDHDISVKEFISLKKIHKKLLPLSLRDLRMIKSQDEIQHIKKACGIGDKAFTYIIKRIKLGITEKQLAFELEIFIKKQGPDLAFPSIVAFDANSVVPHHQTSDQRLTANSFVLLDFGVRFENYCSDMTRTVFFGKPNEKQKKMHQTVLEAQKKAIEYLNNELRIKNQEKNGVKAAEVDKAAREHIVSQKYPSIPHSLGHGIGIEVHEAPSLSPRSKHILKNGMVFSIEPGIYIPGFGGVRIEDLFTTQNGKLTQLTKSPNTLVMN